MYGCVYISVAKITNLSIVGVVICSSFISIGCSGVEGRGVERGVDCAVDWPAGSSLQLDEVKTSPTIIYTG